MIYPLVHGFCMPQYFVTRNHLGKNEPIPHHKVTYQIKLDANIQDFMHLHIEWCRFGISRAWRCCHNWTWFREHHVKGERWNEPSICDKVQKTFQMALSLGDIFSGLMSVFRLSPAILSFHPPTTSSEKWRTATFRSMQLKIVEYPPLLKCSGVWNPWIWGNSSCSSWVFQLCWFSGSYAGYILGMEILQQLWDCKRDPRKAECKDGVKFATFHSMKVIVLDLIPKNTRNQLLFFQNGKLLQTDQQVWILLMLIHVVLHALGTFYHESSNIAR